MASDSQISAYLQSELQRRRLERVTAAEAARWLDGARILRDSDLHPGLPLRVLLRGKKIPGARQENGRRWFIDRIQR